MADIAKADAREGRVVSAGFFDLESYELMHRIARGFAASSMVPQDYRGNSDQAVGNCMMALNIAKRLNADPLMVMQNLVIIHGRPSWSSQFLTATANACGRFSALRYAFEGEPGTDAYGCRAWAIERETGERLDGTLITVAMAKAEKWWGRTGSKWPTMTQQMLTYRAGAFWVRAYAPELSMGLLTKEEMDDITDITPPTRSARAAPQPAKAALPAPAVDVTEAEDAGPEYVQEPSEPVHISEDMAADLRDMASVVKSAEVRKWLSGLGAKSYTTIPAHRAEEARRTLQVLVDAAERDGA